MDVHEEQNQNCLGDHLYNSKNSSYCFDCKDLEDCKYCARLIGPTKTCMDYSSWGDRAELIYQSVSCGDGVYNLKFCSNCTTNNSNLEYCYQCTGCDECFGCTSLKKKKFCILNKQYSEGEYRELVKRIKDEMEEYGEFFPKDLCPHGYNNTLAMDEFPLTKEEALEEGYKWHDPEEQDVGAEGALECDECGKEFKYIPQEMAFYEKMKVPAPKVCPLCRHKARQKARNPIELWERDCGRCGESVKSSISLDRAEKVYCKQCYLSEVY